MPEVSFRPTGQAVQVRPGTSILEAGRKAGIPIRSRCSSGLSCLMCKVKILQGEKELSAPLPAETAKLGPLAGQGYRFACQAKVMGDVTAELPEDPLKAAIRAQLLKSKEEDQLW